MAISRYTGEAAPQGVDNLRSLSEQVGSLPTEDAISLVQGVLFNLGKIAHQARPDGQRSSAYLTGLGRVARDIYSAPREGESIDYRIEREAASEEDPAAPGALRSLHIRTLPDRVVTQDGAPAYDAEMIITPLIGSDHADITVRSARWGEPIVLRDVPSLPLGLEQLATAIETGTSILLPPAGKPSNAD